MKNIFNLLLIISLSFLTISCTQKKEENNLYQEIVSLNKNESIKKDYVWGSRDIPLIDEFEMIEGETTNFDTISGNIIISSYKGYAEFEDVKDFYQLALPQLGWVQVSQGQNNILYQRNSESLEISFKRNGRESWIKFFISST